MNVPDVVEISKLRKMGGSLYVCVKLPILLAMGVKEHDIVVCSVRKQRMIMSKANMKKLLRVQGAMGLHSARAEVL